MKTPAGFRQFESDNLKRKEKAMAKRYVSNMTEYEGYSEAIYDGYKKTSEYMEMSDGCKIAVDIYRPTKNGVLHEEPLPIVWCATQYRRAMFKEDGSITDLEESSALWFVPQMPMILKHGYIIAACDVRGSGASFGNGCAQTPTLQELYDVYDMNEWLAARPYCTHETGMFGISYLGSCQWMCAMMAAPSLKCIVPTSSPFYNPYLRIGGIDNYSWPLHVDEGLIEMNVNNPSPAVDEDKDGSMRLAAIEDHKKNPHTLTLRQTGYYYDDTLPYYNRKVYMETDYSRYFHDVNTTGVACYIIEGLRDFLTTDSFDWFVNLKVPKKLSVGPWDHDSVNRSVTPFNYGYALLRWYDYWLKGIDNGIMDEPPVSIYNRISEEWRHYDNVPIPGAKEVNYYLQTEKAGSIDSLYDGSFGTRLPSDKTGEITYAIDYSVTKQGFEDRNYYNIPGEKDYTGYDKKGATFTTPPLSNDVNIVGFPVIKLWMSADCESFDLYVNIEDVDENGVATNATEGMLRSDFRGLVEPWFDHMGLPFHLNRKRDDKKLTPGEPVLMEFNTSVLSWTFRQGHRIRLTVTHCDKGNWSTPELSPVPNITIYTGKKYPSCVAFPVIGK